MKYQVPEVGEIEIQTIILDLNGTLSVNGSIKNSTKRKLQELSDEGFELILLSGDHRGTAQGFCDELGIELLRAGSQEEKKSQCERFDPNTTASIGNARIDIGTFEFAKIAIATLQSEGIHADVLPYVDVIVPSIDDALEFFLDPDILCATMRK